MILAAIAAIAATTVLVNRSAATVAASAMGLRLIAAAPAAPAPAAKEQKRNSGMIDRRSIADPRSIRHSSGSVPASAIAI